jgi:hypothetical protein
MQKKKCKQCGKNFEAKRSDSLYCSNPCKQQAHHKRSAEKSNSPDKGKERNIFYLDEFNSVDWDDLDLITFCFLRKNFEGEVSKEELQNYISGVLYSEVDFYRNYNSIRKTKAFVDFEEKYLRGEIKVFPNNSGNGNYINGVVK